MVYDSITERLFRTQGIIQFCGDSVAQSVEIFYNKHQQHSLKRTLIQTSIGLFWQGPIYGTSVNLYYRFKINSLVSVACEQGLTSVVYNSGLTVIHPFLNGKNRQEIKEAFWKNYKDLQLRSWIVWIPLSTINFVFVPYQFRTLYTQLTSVAWGSYLSSRNAKLLEKDFSKDYIIAEEGGSLVKHKVTVEQLKKMTDV